MRILWLKTDLLLPLDKGGKLRTWHLMRHLAARHEISYLAFAPPGEPHENLAGMHEVAAHVETVPRTEVAKASAAFFARVAWHLADPLPYAVGQYRSRAYRRRVRELLAARDFDLVVADFLFPVINLPRHLPCPAVLFTHNVEAEIWRRHAETATGTVRRALYGIQHRRMLRYEGRALRRFDGLLAVSDADRETFARLYPGVERDAIYVVPTGVDVDYFSPAPSPAESAELVFTGSMDWLPNEDAMQWFCRDVLPRIREAVPQVRLSIVGRAPTPAVLRLASSHGVRVTGRVDDVRPYIHDAAVFVVPLRIGGGTRLKIFEAMAMGKAVVSTTVGAEGLPVTHQQDILLADNDTSFAQSVVGLLRDIDARRRLEIASRRLVAEHFDWSVVARDLDDALVRCARSANFIEWRKRSDEGLGIWSRICRQRVGGNARQ
jgi:sugar transferase (PEP-CTERM/EpsH1 system associated)